MADYKLVRLEDGRTWLTNGRTGIDCATAFNLVGILKELESCSCNAQIVNGALLLDCESSFDLQALLARLCKKTTKGQVR